ncbi:hypothetical protein D3C80_1232350 [compost metagenome]
MASRLGQRAVLAKAADRAIDQARVDRRQLGIAHPQALGDARAEAFDQHIGGRNQLVHDAQVLWRTQVQRQRTLAAVGHQEHSGKLLAGHAASRVTALGRLDLDHFGAQVGEVLRAQGAGQQLGQVQHAYAGQWFVLSHD